MCSYSDGVGLSSTSTNVLPSLVRNLPQLLGVLAVCGCDTVSYPVCHGKAMALKVLKSAEHSGLYSVFGEEGATLEQLMETRRTFICSLYGVAAGKNMSSVR